MFQNKIIFKILLAILSFLWTVAVARGQEFFDTRIHEIPEHCDLETVFNSCVEATECTKLSGYYPIRNRDFSNEPFLVFCDAVTNGGGWTVIEQRKNDSIDFYRTWLEYENGFGYVDTSFFIGFHKLLAIIKQLGPVELHIAIDDNKMNQSVYVSYDNFIIGNSTEDYKLKSLGNFKGNTSNALDYHRNAVFSTKDRNTMQCAQSAQSAWWYKNCAQSDLNKPYGDMYWFAVTDIKYLKMMIRPSDYLKENDCIVNPDIDKLCNPNAYPTNCIEAIACTHTSSLNILNQAGYLPYLAQCVADVNDGGGWLVIQSRQDHSVNFSRTFRDYQIGFGDVLRGEFFIGLDKLHSFGPQELYIELINDNGEMVYAKYDNFVIANATKEYKIKSFGKYSGTAGNSFDKSLGVRFTVNNNNECTLSRYGGWWMSTTGPKCYIRSSLNAAKMVWETFPGVTKTRMMIRPRRCIN